MSFAKYYFEHRNPLFTELFWRGNFAADDQRLTGSLAGRSGSLLAMADLRVRKTLWILGLTDWLFHLIPAILKTRGFSMTFCFKHRVSIGNRFITLAMVSTCSDVVTVQLFLMNYSVNYFISVSYSSVISVILDNITTSLNIRLCFLLL